MALGCGRSICLRAGGGCDALCPEAAQRPCTQDGSWRPPGRNALTTFRGNELRPSFSPDGNQVAFSWNGPRQDNHDIYIKLLGVAEPVRLTTYPGLDFAPAWSPDGRWIAFLRRAERPELGGSASVVLFRLLEAQSATLPRSGPQGTDQKLSWDPSGKWIAVTDLGNARVGSLFLSRSRAERSGESLRRPKVPFSMEKPLSPPMAES